MSVSRKENGSLVKKAGRVLVDLALSLTSNNPPANRVVTQNLNQKVTKFSGTDSGNTYVTVDQIAYDETNKKLGLKVNGADTVIPFSGEIKATLIATRSTGWGSTDSSGYTAIPSKYKALIVQFTGANFTIPKYVYFRNGDKNEIGAETLNNSYGRDFTFSNNKLTHSVCGNAQTYAGDIYESRVYGIETALL